MVAIHADETDVVQAGAPLLTLDPADADVALAQAEAQLGQTVREGDVITTFNAKPVKNGDDLVAMVSEMPVGARVPVTVLREGKKVELNLQIADRSQIIARDSGRENNPRSTIQRSRSSLSGRAGAGPTMMEKSGAVSHG